MRLRRPPMIPILRIAGGLACGIGAALVIRTLWTKDMDLRLLVLAAGAGAAGLFSLGFATNLVILHDIRTHLLTERERPDREP